MIDTKELRSDANTAHFGHTPLEVSGSEMLELLDRLEAAEKERDALRAKVEAAERERDVLRDRLALESQENGALRDSVDRACEERDALRAKVESMEKQEPVGVLHVGSCYGEELEDWEFEADQRVCDHLNERHVSNPTSLKIYALSGSQGE